MSSASGETLPVFLNKSKFLPPMTTGDDFIPDYAYRLTAGITSTRKSKLFYNDNTAYISVHNRIHLWNTVSMEETEILGSGKRAVSCLALAKDGTVIIGYENGLVEIVLASRESVTVRLHRRRVTQIVPCFSGFVSASVDGSICHYDMILEEPLLRYVGNAAAVERIAIIDDKILAVCADKMLKIWSKANCEVTDAYAFDDYLFGMAAWNGCVLVACRSGRTFMLDLTERTRRPFETFNRIRNLIHKDAWIVVQMPKKIVAFKTILGTSPTLEAVLRADSSDSFVSLDVSDGRLLVLSKDNSMKVVGIADAANDSKALTVPPAKSNVISHASDIIQMEIHDDSVYTLSEERLLVWERVVEDKYEDVSGADGAQIDGGRLEYALSPVRWLELSKSRCFCVFGGYLVIGRGTGFAVYQDGAVHEDFAVGKVCSLSCRNDVLAVAVDTIITFYDDTFAAIGELHCQEPIVFSRFTPCGSMFCVSTLDNKINVFNFPSQDLRISLYGHSLPVRSFAFSRDGRQLISCGADKLVKIWGLEFGECRKSIVANAQNVEPVLRAGDDGGCADDLFLFCDRDIIYYRNFHKLRAYRCFNPGIVRTGSDFFVVTTERGVSLFTMNRHEYLEDDLSEEIDHAMAGVVAEMACYERFLTYLEQLGDSWSDATAKAFYVFLEQTELSELSAFLQILDARAVATILSLLEASFSPNTVLNGRIFILLLQFHKDIVRTSLSFDGLRARLLAKTRELQDLSSENEMRLLVETKREKTADREER